MSFKLKGNNSLLQYLPIVKILLRNTATLATARKYEEVDATPNNQIEVLTSNPNIKSCLNALHKAIKTPCDSFAELENRKSQQKECERKKANDIITYCKILIAVPTLKFYPQIKLNDTILINAFLSHEEVVKALGETPLMSDGLVAANDNGC